MVGEATKRLSNEFRRKYPDVLWTKMAGLRDRLMHGHDKVDLDLLWVVVRERIPELLLLLGDIMEVERIDLSPAG